MKKRSFYMLLGCGLLWFLALALGLGLGLGLGLKKNTDSYASTNSCRFCCVCSQNLGIRNMQMLSVDKSQSIASADL